MTTQITKIKSVLNEINEDESRILAGRQGTIIKTLTRALEVAVDALEEIKCYGHSDLCTSIKPIRQNYRCAYEEATECINQIVEILEVKP